MRPFLAVCLLVALPMSAIATPTTPSTGLSAAELEAASQLGETIAMSEWLGPLAPVALSPFFGMACLAAIAQFGPETVVSSNGFLSAESPLQNPFLLWVFAGLALATSLPRLTKVSKPIAGALEQIESYSSIITLVAIRYLISQDAPAVEGTDVVYAAGIGTVTVDAMLSIAAAINIVVINAVKFFFEFLIWLVPIPALDAVFEASNKAVVAFLMAIYSVSPLAATMLNLVLFAICAVLFVWTRRQVVFMRTILIGWFIGWLKTGRPPTTPDIVVFAKDDFGPFPARERLMLSRTTDGLVLTRRSLFGGSTEHPVTVTRSARIEPGWIAHSLILSDDGEHCGRLLLSRSHTPHLDVVAALLHIDLAEEDVESARVAAREQLGPLKAKPA